MDDRAAHTEESLRRLLGPLEGGEYELACCGGLLTWRNGVEAGIWTALAFHGQGCGSNPDEARAPTWSGGVWWVLARIVPHPYGEIRVYDVTFASHSTEGR